MIVFIPRLSGFNFVSRRGAEKAEVAEIFELKGMPPSARFAFSAPLRETFSALRAGATL